MSYLRVTIEIDGVERRVEKTEFDLAALHPDRRQAEILNLIDAYLLKPIAEHLGVYDALVEDMRRAREGLGAEEFEAMLADSDPAIRTKLIAAGLLKAELEDAGRPTE